MFSLLLAKTDYVLWFYSTCAETFASLIAIFGLFVVFRLQVEEGRVGALRERMIHFQDSLRLLPFDSVLRELKKLEEYHLTRQETDRSEHIRALLEDYRGATAQRFWLSRAARRPLVMLVALNFWSVLMMPLYPAYIGHPILTALLVWLTVFVAGWVLIEVVRIVVVSIRTD